MYKNTTIDDRSTLKKLSNKVADNIAVCYVRFSSDNQRYESIEAQKRYCIDYAEKNRLIIVKFYEDIAKTATNSDREAFQQMIEDSSKGLFKTLLVFKLDRFSRSVYDSAIYKRTLKKNGIKLISVTEPLLDGSPEGGLLETLLEGVNQFYSQNLAREALKGMKETAYKCQHTGGFPPLGYDIEPATKKYIINESEAKIIRTIFEKYSEGMGYKQLLEYLNIRGYKTKQGNPFGSNSLNTILKNEKYIGTFVFNKRLEKDVTGKRNPQVKPKDEWIVIENGMPAIIDKDTFNKVQTKLVQNLRTGGSNKAKEIYLLSGLIYCGECGSAMYGNTRMCGRNKSKYSSYRCSDRAQHKGCSLKELRKEYLESFVFDELQSKLFSDDSIKKLSSMLNDYNRRKTLEVSEELSQAKSELSEVMNKISMVVKLVADSGIDISTVSGELKQLEIRKHFLEGLVHEITLTNNAPVITEDVIVDLINQSKEFVKNRQISACKNFINSYIEKVVVYHERVEVRFKINIPDNDSVVPLVSKEAINVLQKEYRDTVYV